ncbi:UNVERIFIED_CONTAM: hypothetical protein Sradi_5057600 [Sesamum radiatum]|uniref:Uncharacterized protein n=1 Tax=Sesamum radiatum TaxID=300843 RepID=A0AAW2M1D7_SESRA
MKGIQNNVLDGILAMTKFARGEKSVRAPGTYPCSYSRCGVLWIQLFSLPATVIEKIHRFCKIFLWNSKRAPAVWEEICHPKKDGGLSIRHIQSWNVALLARVLWNIHRKVDKFGVKWVNEVYLRSVSLWDWQPKKGDSLLLRRLANIQDIVVTAFGSSEAAVQCMMEWSNIKGVEKSKVYVYLRLKLTRQL